MLKDFDHWNENKKQIDLKERGRTYRVREIWWCSLGLNIGYEQDGTGENNERPVLIYRAFSKHVCLIIPLTSSKKKNPYHFALGVIDSREAFAIISQIRLIDTKRLINQIGIIDRELFENIRKTIKDML